MVEFVSVYGIVQGGCRFLDLIEYLPKVDRKTMSTLVKKSWTLSKHFELNLNPLFQTLNSISAEKNSTIIFPLPIDFISHFLKGGDEKEKKMD